MLGCCFKSDRHSSAQRTKPARHLPGNCIRFVENHRQTQRPGSQNGRCCDVTAGSKHSLKISRFEQLPHLKDRADESAQNSQCTEPKSLLKAFEGDRGGGGTGWTDWGCP